MEENKQNATPNEPSKINPKEPLNSTNANPKDKDLVMTAREYEDAKMKQRFIPAVIAGLIVAAACSVLWAGISLATGYQIGYMAIAIGLAVGFTIKKVGRGVTPVFGVVGAIIALASCVVGNVLLVAGYLHQSGLDNTALLPTMIETFHPMDIIFYGIALYEGYKFSFKKITIAGKDNVF